MHGTTHGHGHGGSGGGSSGLQDADDDACVLGAQFNSASLNRHLSQAYNANVGGYSSRGFVEVWPDWKVWLSSARKQLFGMADSDCLR